MITSTDPDDIPQRIRDDAFDAAVAAARRVLDENGCGLDDLLIYELLDIALADIAIGLGVPPAHSVN